MARVNRFFPGGIALRHCFVNPLYVQLQQRLPIFMYVFLNSFFVVFHGSLTLFNLTGWIWKKTRRLHLLTIGLTLLSWVGLGIFYGWGYCPSTDWHWEVKQELGETNLPNSYIKYYADYLTGMNWDPFVVDVATACITISVFLISCLLNWRDWKRERS